MNKLKYLLFVFILLFSYNVFATNSNVASKIKYDTDTVAGTYKGDEIQLGGSSGPYSIGTRYNGSLSLIEFYLSTSDYDFVVNHTYTITLNMATNDWRNNFMSPQVIKANSDGSLQTTNQTLSVSNFRFVSRKQIKFDFKTNSTISPYLFFRLYSTDYATNNTIAITGDNNWNLSSIYIDDNSSSSSSGNSGSGSSTTNTSLTCSNGLSLSTKDFTDDDISISDSYINSSGNIVSFSGYGVITYIPIKANTDYVINKTTNTSDVASYCLSSSTSSYGSCFPYNLRNSIAFNSGSSTYLTFTLKYGETATLGTCVSPIDNQNQNTQDIIDNQNQNTQDIINNNNDNTQQIIDNQNSNTEKQIESQKACVMTLINRDFITTPGKFIRSNGSTFTDVNWGITDYLKIDKGDISVVYSMSSQSQRNTYGAWYDSDKNLISTFHNYELTDNQILTPPTNAVYVRFSINIITNIPRFNMNICKDGNQSITDSINNSNIDDDLGNGFFDDFTSQDFGLSQIITIPLNTIQSLTSKSCVPLQVPIPFTNSNINLPCMTEIYETKFSIIYNLWKIVSFGIVAYLIAIDIFHIVKGFKDPESDKVEVLDL